MNQRSRFFYGWVIVAIALVMMTVGYALRNTFSVFYPVLVEEFGWDRGNTALMFSFNIIVYGMVAPVAGGLVDRFSPRTVFPAGVCLMGGAVALCSLATEQWHFYLLYGVAAACGLSICGLTPIVALVARWFVRKRALAFGIFNMGFGISLLVSPFAQSLITSLGHQQAYLTIGILAIAVTVPLIAAFIRRSPEDRGTWPDGTPPAAAVSRETQQPQHETAWMRKEWTLKRALATRQFWFLFVADLCLLGLAQQIVIAHSVYFFRDAGIAPHLAASSVSFYGIGIIVGNLFAYFSDRVGREKVLIPGCLLAATATGLLLLVQGPAFTWMGFASMLFCGLGMGAAATTFFATVADLFQGPNYGAIQGLMTFGFSIGGAFSPWFAGHLYDTTGSYSPAIVFAVGALVLAGLLVTMAAPRKVRPVPHIHRTAATDSRESA